MHFHQTTIHQRIQVSGIGLHTGKPIEVVLSPLPIDSGIWFQRTDTPKASALLASTENVTDTELATTIGSGHESISTIEHLLATLGGLGISNLKIEVNGPELPILDGSAAPWASLLQKAGIKTFNAPRSYYRVKKNFRLTNGDKFLEVEPSSHFSMDVTLMFPGFLEKQSKKFVFSKSAFVSEICPARTFCLAKDIEFMQKNHRALGGGLDNAVVINLGGQILNPEGLRFPDEFARHKILDLIGDLTLAQAPILGHFTAYKTGHTLNQKFLHDLLKTPGLLERVTFESNEKLDSLKLSLPSVALAS
ncbi:MAG: UDP-3-O-acyl-N-acetylglucosamine deacetylase [Deltaproteobacteria bacterium]|jgi:UDP-3-O-[3-hydroxymyristoyl] N-acetylglucosamine deacetylase|nr:UDP-3-O-acyl-N-acetylglucosamine deacetylase [Deltaproteobacteria bacterium]